MGKLIFEMQPHKNVDDQELFEVVSARPNIGKEWYKTKY